MTSAAEAAPVLSQVKFRLAEESDLAFVYNAIVKTMINNSRFSSLEASYLTQNHNRLIASCLKRPTTKLVIATPDDDPHTILGFLLAEPKAVLHFVYVKAALRRFGVAKGLLASLGMVLDESLIFTHFTNTAAEVLKAKHYRCRYYPYRFAGV